jgi:hypothetical protein
VEVIGTVGPPVSFPPGRLERSRRAELIAAAVRMTDENPFGGSQEGPGIDDPDDRQSLELGRQRSVAEGLSFCWTSFST